MSRISEILQKKFLNREDIIYLLKINKDDAKVLFDKSREIKLKYVGNKVYFRGIIEFSNICIKNCYYCGIRRGNPNVERYNINDETIMDAVIYAYKSNMGSVVLQSGERKDKEFTNRITNLLRKIKEKTGGKLGITLSLGEQTKETYKDWYDAGAHRYLLRIEVSNPVLYKKLHPADALHSYKNRIMCLNHLQNIGYQTGTGIMVGLPFQTVEDLADDLIFFREKDIDMVGLGPYIEHKETPLFRYSPDLLPLKERLFMTFKVISILRIMMKDINIAATTAMQSIDPMGREKAVQIAANVIMPNITPGIYRKDYFLYENKPCSDENTDDCLPCLINRLKMVNAQPALGLWGDSKHFFRRIKQMTK